MQMELPQQRRGVGCSHGEVGWRGEELDAGNDGVSAQEGRSDCDPLKNDKATHENT